MSGEKVTSTGGQVDDLVEPIAANMRVVDAGTLKVGVEFRELNARIIRENYGHDPDAMKFFESMMDVDDVGITLHVYSADDMAERLRFDAFGDKEHLHYHYIFPDGTHRKVSYDEAACGEMVLWALRTLDARLPEMLREAGANDVASRVDRDAFRAAMPGIAEVVSQLLTDHPGAPA